MQLIGDARRAAFGGLIDYAGLFPPASLDMADATAGYREARSGSAAWVAGRFLCPTSRLEDLAAALTASMTADEPPWMVGAVFDEELGTAASHAASFHAYADPAASVQTAEVGLHPEGGSGGVRDAVLAASSINTDAAIYLEVPRTPSWEEEIPTTIGWIAETRAEWRRDVGAKLRCGGAEPASFPSPEQVAMFIISCEQHGLPFKATAGLHHPVRHFDPDLGVTRHGFLNILAAALVAAESAPFHEVAAVLADDDPASFSVAAGAFAYRGGVFATRSITAARRAALVAYGSCDFREPVGDLASMGML